VEQARTRLEDARTRARTSAGRWRFDAYREANGAARAALEARLDRRIVSATRTARAASASLTFLAVAGAAVTAVGARRISRGIVEPLARLAETLERLRAGDQHARAVVEGPAELRTVSAAVNALVVDNQALTAEQFQRVEREQALRRISGCCTPA